MDKDVVLISKRAECIEACEEAIEKALINIGIEWQNSSSLICPVDTGRLSASINYATKSDRGQPNTSAINKERIKKTKKKLKTEDYTPKGSVKKNTVVVGTNVEYGQKIENSTHFLRLGLENNKRTFKRILKDELEGN